MANPIDPGIQALINQMQQQHQQTMQAMQQQSREQQQQISQLQQQIVQGPGRRPNPKTVGELLPLVISDMELINTEAVANGAADHGHIIEPYRRALGYIEAGQSMGEAFSATSDITSEVSTASIIAAAVAKAIGGSGRGASRRVVSTGQGTGRKCGHCGRTGHTKTSCHAVTHADGSRLAKQE